MAIIIHSSDIYDKSYTPLKDNIINSIETSAKNVSTTYTENINVYSSSANIEDTEISQSVIYDEHQDEQVWGYGGSEYYWEKIYNQVFIKVRKITINSFTIPKVSETKKITKLTNNKLKIDFNTKVDYYENAHDISNSGDTFDDVTKSTNQNGLFVNDLNAEFIFNGKVADKYGTVKITSQVKITNNINENNINFTVTSSGTFGSYGNTSSTIIQPITSSKVLTFEKEVEVQEENDYYIVPTFTVICGYDARICYRWEESNPVAYSDEAPTSWTRKEANVTRYDVKPISINMNLDGNIISIDLKEKVQTFGDTVNRKNSYKTDENELIQITNTYNGKNAVEKFAKDILTHYTNGKEIAELQCSISNYYDESGKLVIGTKQYRGSYSTLITFAGIRPFQGKYMIIFSGDIANNAYAVQYSNEQVNVEKDRNLNYIIVDENSIFYKVYNENYSIIVNVLCEKLNRLFEVGDEVIPYTYTAYGEKPLSTYKNGDHKVYKVIGVQLIDEGICWQKLTIQEK